MLLMSLQTKNNRTFYSACLLYFILWVQWNISLVMLPIFVDGLGASPFEVGLIWTVFTTVMIFSGPIFGIYSDRIGRRKPFIVFGMLGLVPVFVLISTQTTPLAIILARGSTAIFAGAILPTLFALVRDISPPESIGRNLGILNAAGTVGFAIGPMVGGAISDIAGLPALWLFVATLCLIGGLTFLIAGEESEKGGEERRRRSSSSSQSREPSLKFFIISISLFVFLIGQSLVGPSLNVYLNRDLGYSKTTIGFIILVASGPSIFLQPKTGSYSDRHGRKPALLLLASTLAAGNIVLFFASDIYLVLLAYVLVRYSTATFEMVGDAYITDIAIPEKISGTLGIFRSVGSLSRGIGSATGGLIISATGITTTMLLSALFPTVSVFIILLFLQTNSNQVK